MGWRLVRHTGRRLQVGRMLWPESVTVVSVG